MKVSLCLFVLTLSLGAFGQVPVSSSAPQALPTPKPANGQQNDDKEIIRISSQLVLVDTLVLNKNGQQVTDLNAGDFEVFQDGKSQKIINFTYVDAARSDTGVNGGNFSNIKKGKNQLPVPPISLRGNEGRILTFVIDDGNCLSTPEGLASARDAMKKFINGQMLADDKVAIYRTRGGSSLLQLYTSNKEVLKRVVDKVNWFPSGCGSAFDDSKNDATYKGQVGSSGQGTFESKEGKEFRTDHESDEREKNVIGTTGVLNFVVERLKNLPERKIVFLISEGIPVKLGSRGRDALREVADKASRSSVVIYTMSEKGVTIPGMIEARDEVNTDEVKEARIEEERSLNDGLSYLAYATGGEFVRNNNFLDTGIKRILGRETGYYLIGYQPEDETFDGKGFHNIEIKLKRPELKVVSRKGFYGRADTVSKNKSRTAESPLYQAIASPLQENGIALRLTTLIENNQKEGNLIRAIFHIEGKDLTLTDEPNGVKKTVLDVVAVTLDEKGKVIDEFNRTYPIRIPQQGVQTVVQNGLDYSTTLPVKKAGFYSFRVAVRDQSTKRLGSAGDFVEIPDLSKGKFFMSGLITTTITNDGKPLLPKDRAADAAFTPVFVSSIPSIRQYHAGDALAYAYQIYNAKPDQTSKQPKLTTQIQLYKNGKVIVEGKEMPAQIEPQPDMLRIRDYGLFRLNQNAETGEYILQVTVKDLNNNKTASQWIDFEVVK